MICVCSTALDDLVDVAALSACLVYRGVALKRAEGDAGSLPDAAAFLVTGKDTHDQQLWNVAREAGCPVLMLRVGEDGRRLSLAEFVAEDGHARDRRGERLLGAFGATLGWDTILAAAQSLSPGEIAALRGAAREGESRDQTLRRLAVEALFNRVPPDPRSLAAALDEALRAVGRGRAQRVSVVITSHNYRDFLPEAIRSALDQTLAPAEVVVVDDGSTDGSAAIVAGSAGIVPVLKANGGQASAFNAGFARTTGDIVIFLDADDRLLPDAVERVSWANLRDISRLFYGLETIDTHGRPLGLYAARRAPPSGVLAGALMTAGIFSFAPTSGNAFPRWVLDRLLPMPDRDFRLCADLYLVLASAVLGMAADAGEVLGQYRIHGRNGHYLSLGSEPYLARKRRAQRISAWKALIAAVPRLTGRDLGDPLRLALHRLVLAARVDAPSAWREGLRGVALAAQASSLPLSERLRHAGQSLRLLPAREGGTMRTGVHMLEEVGASSWPMLTPGDDAPTAGPVGIRRAFGRGWAEGDGVLGISSTTAAIGFRVPEWSCSWRVRLTFAVTGYEPIRDVEVSLNGRRIDRLALSGRGVIDLKLPAELMVPFREAFPRGRGLAVCLRLSVPAMAVGRLSVSGLRADILPEAEAPAPFVRLGGALDLAARSGHGLDDGAGRALGEGWDWPDGNGATLAAESGTINISAQTGHDLCLTFRLGAPLTGRPASEAVQAVVNGAFATIHDSVDGWSFSLRIGAGQIAADGRLAMELAVLPDAATGAWPVLSVRSLRIDHLGPIGRLRLVPNIPCNPGAAARIAGDTFRLSVTRTAMQGAAYLRLRIVTEAEQMAPAPGDLTIGQNRQNLILARENDIVLAVPDEPADRIELAGQITGGARCAIETLTLLPCDPGASPPEGTNPSVAALGPRDLARCVLSAGAWHPSTEDALWLAADRAVLRLPPMPAHVQALEVEVLTLPDPPQRLTLQLDGAPPVTSSPGRSVLTLTQPASGWGEGADLAVSTDLLVASSALNVGGCRMLGGAILRMTPLAVQPRGKAAAAPQRRKGARARQRAEKAGA